MEVSLQVRKLGVAITQLAVVAFAMLVLGSFLSIWPFSLLEHFRIHYVLGGLLVVGVAAVVVRRGWLDVALVCWLLELCAIAPDLTSAARPVPAGIAARVLLLNVHTSSTGFEPVRRLIRDERPDVIALVEINQRWLDELAPALAGYPSRITHARADNFGIALYARGKLEGGVEELGTDLPTIVATIDLERRVSVIITHPLPPMTARLLDAQHQQFAAIARRTRELARPLIVMGDFNATPWSRPYRRLRDGTGTCDTRAGFGAQTSFPADSWLLRIPIDHVLVSCEMGVREHRIGPDVHSDHLPVIVDLVVPK